MSQPRSTTGDVQPLRKRSTGSTRRLSELGVYDDIDISNNLVAENRRSSSGDLPEAEEWKMHSRWSDYTGPPTSDSVLQSSFDKELMLLSLEPT